jgi:hypothetical protein
MKQVQRAELQLVVIIGIVLSVLLTSCSTSSPSPAPTKTATIPVTMSSITAVPSTTCDQALLLIQRKMIRNISIVRDPTTNEPEVANMKSLDGKFYVVPLTTQCALQIIESAQRVNKTLPPGMQIMIENG